MPGNPTGWCGPAHEMAAGLTAAAATPVAARRIQATTMALAAGPARTPARAYRAGIAALRPAAAFVRRMAGKGRTILHASCTGVTYETIPRSSSTMAHIVMGQLRQATSVIRNCWSRPRDVLMVANLRIAG